MLMHRPKRAYWKIMFEFSFVTSQQQNSARKWNTRKLGGKTDKSEPNVLPGPQMNDPEIGTPIFPMRNHQKSKLITQLYFTHFIQFT